MRFCWQQHVVYCVPKTPIPSPRFVLSTTLSPSLRSCSRLLFPRGTPVTCKEKSLPCRRIAAKTPHRQIPDPTPAPVQNPALPRDRQHDFAEKVIDVVGLYMDPPENALVLSVDEKTQSQALDRTQPMLQLKPGQIERRTHDYKRHGTASLFAAFDVASGEVMGRITKRHRAIEFLAFLRQIEQAVHPDLDVHLILDNSSTHKTQKIRNWFLRRPRFHLHFTPTSASWLNAVETWFSQLERRSLYRNSFTSVQELRNEIRRYIRVHNQHLAKPFKWRANATSILDKVERVQRSIGQC